LRSGYTWVTKGAHFLTETGPASPESALRKVPNGSETTLRRGQEQSAQNRHGPCDDKIAKGATSQNMTVQPGFDFAMLDTDRPEQTAEDGALADAKPACVALVPVIPAAQWSRTPSELSRPNSIFVTHLIASAEQVPQMRSLRRATPADAQSAYGAPRLQRAGIRMRQII
jgi:hypothetical protein